VRVPLAVKAVMTVALLIAFSLGLAGLLLERREREAVTAQMLARLDALASLLAAEVAGDSTGDAWASRAGGRANARVTLIAHDGRVLGDSQQASAGMESHAGRPEVIEALQQGTGVARRHSVSVDVDLVYFARRVDRPGRDPVVLRLAVPRQEVAQGFVRFRRDFAGIAAVSLAVASLIAILWARRIVRPLHGMIDFARAVPRAEAAHRLPRPSRDELGDLADALSRMASDLHGTLARLEEESRRTRTIVENIAEGLMLLDARGRISLVNSAGETLLSISSEKALGQRPLEVVRSHELDDLLRAAIAQGSVATGEILLSYPRRRILAGSAVAVRDAAGAVQGTVLALRDVTLLKRLEEMRMEFVVNVSHELRTPLTAIRGYVETLLEGALEDRQEARRFLEVVRRHATRLGRLLDDLLDLSNIELGRTPLDVRPVALGEIARQVAALLAPQAERKTLRLEVRVADDLPHVLADRDRLAQILVNLIDNAVKYTPEGGEVCVTAQACAGSELPEPAPDAVEVVVADTGIGIAPAHLPRLTERFYRVDRARSRELGGTGLGLAIVKHLVEAHRGVLTLESELGKGTRVRVLLPAARTSISGA